jgi:hypothetical protein
MFANAGSYGILLLSQVIVAIGSCTAFVGAGYIGGLWFGMAKFGFMLSAIYVRNPAPLAGRMDRGVGDFFTSVIGNIAKVAAIGHVWIASLIGAAQFGVMLALGVVKRFQMPAQ